MFVRFLCVCALFLVTAAVVQAEPKTLKLRNGSQITGEVTKTDSGYHVVMKYGEADYPVSDVLEVVTETSPLQDYQQRAAKIDPNSAEDHYSLGEWAMNANLLEQARDEFAAAVRIKPGMEKASLLLRQVELKLSKRERRHAASAAAPSAASRPATALEEWLLSDDDINRIRVEELEPNDRVRVEFANDVINRYIEAMRSLPEFRDVNAEDVACFADGFAQPDQIRPFAAAKVDAHFAGLWLTEFKGAAAGKAAFFFSETAVPFLDFNRLHESQPCFFCRSY